MTDNKRAKEYRSLPSVDELLKSESIQAALRAYSRELVVSALRDALAEARNEIARGGECPEPDAIAHVALKLIAAQTKLSLRRAINASGIILHTGLGRAVLSEQAQRAVNDVAAGHCTLEIDESTGKRGSRQEHISRLLTDLTGAESALVVNNNAAAVILAVNTLALGREAIISRGQLVEIGGSFRMPDIIERAGARMVEVGTTNRTRISDYEKAVTSQTGMLLRCHPSNYQISGFVEEASLQELVDLGARTGISVVDDLGSGALIDLSHYGLDREPTVQDSLQAGADIITFSGDKLLGASQAGILVGKKRFIDLCRANPLARALRVDKLTLAALEATLHIYREGDPATDIPVLAALSRYLSEIDQNARELANRISSLAIEGLCVEVIASTSETGGGSLPGQSIESRSLALKSDKLSAEDLARRFREFEPPIFGRIVKDVFLLDMRTVNLTEVSHILACVELSLS